MAVKDGACAVDHHHMVRTSAVRPHEVDAAAIDAVRARVAGGVALSACGAMLLPYFFPLPMFPADEHPVVVAVTVQSFLAIGLWLVVRGPRVADLEYLALVCATLVLTAWFVIEIQAPRAPVGMEWVALSAAINAAVFARRRWQVALIGVVATSAMVAAAWLRLGPEGGGALAALVEVFTTGVVVVTVRALREVAVNALERANRGEVTDPLTGVANRRGLERRGGRIWREAGERQTPVSLLVIDIDHFKRINDTLGHAEGDRVIRELAALLEASLRADDLVVRLGGEEFLVVLRTGRDEAAMVAERIRARAAAELAPVTISVGVADSVPGPDDALPQALWQAVDVADKALYSAKESGRNRVVAAA